MATIADISIIDSNAAEARRVQSGTERTLCSRPLCGSNNLTVSWRTIAQGRQFDPRAGDDWPRSRPDYPALKWYYEREGPDEELVEWNQSHRESGSVRAGD
jgi:hypothetical protein